MTHRLNPSATAAWLVLALLSAPALARGVFPAGHANSSQDARQVVTRDGEVLLAGAQRKPGSSGVVLQYRVDGIPQPNVPVPVVLEFDGVSAPEGAIVRLRPDAGLRLQGGATLTLAPGKPSTATVLVVSEREGLAYLNVFISEAGASSALSIPIQTGLAEALRKSNGALRSTPDGEKIITLPAK